jgi:branched-chain amino acid transport system permease protein
VTVLQKLQLALSRTREQATEDLLSVRGALFSLVALLALLAPFVFGPYVQSVVLQMLIMVLAVASWNFIAGYFGMFSFTHAALYGIGGYATVISAMELGVEPLVAIAIGGLAAGLFSLPITLPALRLGGSYLAMVTLAYAEVIHLAAVTFRDITGGPTGLTGYTPMFGNDRVVIFYFTAAVVVLFLSVQYVLTVSRFGLIARAIRESEQAAQMLGNNTYRHKLLGFFIGSSLAGIAGGLQVYNVLIISPPMLNINQMIDFMAMTVIGGMGVFGGPVVGVAVVLGLSELLRGLPSIRLLVWGVLLLVIIMFFPNGIAGSDVQSKLIREQVDGLRKLVGGDDE